MAIEGEHAPHQLTCPLGRGQDAIQQDLRLRAVARGGPCKLGITDNGAQHVVEIMRGRGRQRSQGLVFAQLAQPLFEIAAPEIGGVAPSQRMIERRQQEDRFSASRSGQATSIASG